MDQTERFLALEAASIDAATRGFKALLILNGGACGALFAFTALLATSEYLRPEFKEHGTAITQPSSRTT